MMDKNKQYKAIGFILMSAFGFALMNAFVRLSGDLPFIQKTFFRNLVAMLVAGGVMVRDRISLGWEKGNLPWMLGRSICGTLGIFCNFYAIDHLVLADANILNKMSPFFAILFSFLLLRERVSWIQGAAVLLAFGGSLLIIKPGFGSASFAAGIGLLGGIMAGAAYTMVRILSRRGEKSARIVCFFSGFSTLCAVPYLLTNFAPMQPIQLIYLLLAGLAAALGQFGVTLAYSYAPAKEISVYDYTQVLFSALLGFFLFGQIPDGWSIVGYCIICGVSIFMFLRNKRAQA